MRGLRALILIGLTGCAQPDPIPVPSGGPNLLPSEVLARAGTGMVLDDPQAEALLETVSEYLALSREMGDALWPGWSLDGQPLAVLIPGDRMLLLAHDDPMPGMRLVQQEAIDEAVFIGNRAPDCMGEGLAHFRGHTTLFLTSETTYPRFIQLGALAIMMIDEEPAGQAVDEWLPLLFPERNLLRRMEARYLMDAIAGQTLEPVGLFIKVRAERRQGLSLETCALEDRLEQGEGMALYIRHRAQSLLGREPGPFLEEVIQSGYGSGAKGFAATGMAQALLLDRWAPAWKERLMEEAGLNMAGLLAEIAPEVADPDRGILLNNGS